MSIEDTGRIDILRDDGPSTVLLVAIDNLPWDAECGREHALMLKKKLMTYYRFIKSGEMVKYPQHVGKAIAIEVSGKMPLDDAAKRFYRKAKRIFKNAGVELRFKQQERRPDLRIPKGGFELDVF